jgi:hypothetical protein
MTRGRTLPILLFALAVAGALESAGAPGMHAEQTAPAAPIAVRNDTPRPGTEVLVLRHQQLKRGEHDAYYDASREGVWPWFEKIGTRIVGQWLVIEGPQASSAGTEDAYRLARYASFEHWRATRDVSNARLGGNGPDREASVQSGRERTDVQLGSKGAYFLQGENAPTRPLYMPALDESYERTSATGSAATDEVIAVRNAAARPGREVVELRYQRIQKGAFDRFVRLTRDAIWPWEEKLGVRPLGQWKVIYPDAPSRTKDNPDFDEVLTMTRYASRDHRDAVRPDRAVLLGGNGPDWRAWRRALDTQMPLVRETSVELMEGQMYHSPPLFMPGLGERYRLAR